MFEIRYRALFSTNLPTRGKFFRYGALRKTRNRVNQDNFIAINYLVSGLIPHIAVEINTLSAGTGCKTGRIILHINNPGYQVRHAVNGNRHAGDVNRAQKATTPKLASTQHSPAPGHFLKYNCRKPA